MSNSAFRKPLPGTALDYYDVIEAVESIEKGAYAKLPTHRSLGEPLPHQLANGAHAHLLP